MFSLTTAEVVWVKTMSKGYWGDLLVKDVMKRIKAFGGEVTEEDPSKYKFSDGSFLKIYDSGIFCL